MDTKDSGWAEAISIAQRLCRKFEGCRLEAYYCPAGVITIGYGATGFGVFPGQCVSKEWAENRLNNDLTKFMVGVAKLCPSVVSNPSQWGAITDFAFNLGLGALQGSTLRKRVNAGDWGAAKVELAKWVRGGGKVLPGLVLRRSAEAALI